VTLISLGVVDIPYVDRETDAQARSRVKKNRRAAKPQPKTNTMSTGDVADILEAQYHVMEIFAEHCEDDIMGYLETSLAGSLESIMQGGGNGPPPFAEAESAIKERFDRFITQKEMDGLGYPGVPTKASLAGVSHRFKHPYARRPSRPSFVDTGLWLASMVAEIEG